jgi:hypothetical protein
MERLQFLALQIGMVFSFSAGLRFGRLRLFLFGNDHLSAC